MAVQFDPIAKDESLNTTEQTTRNIADVLAQELSGISNAITGGDGKAPKTDIATVEPSNTASRAYSVGELVYVNGNLYKVITAIASGATFTVGTNIQSKNVSGAIKEVVQSLPLAGVVTGFNGPSETISLDISSLIFDISHPLLLTCTYRTGTPEARDGFAIVKTDGTLTCIAYQAGASELSAVSLSGNTLTVTCSRYKTVVVYGFLNQPQ